MSQNLKSIMWIKQFWDNIKAVCMHYMSFQGKASHIEFWCWILALVIISIFFMALLFFLGMAPSVLYFTIIVGAGLFPPTLSVTVRRLRDAGHSGWWLVLWFILGVGTILFGFLSGYLLQAMDPTTSVSLLAKVVMVTLILILLGLSVTIVFWLASPSNIREL